MGWKRPAKKLVASLEQIGQYNSETAKWEVMKWYPYLELYGGSVAANHVAIFPTITTNVEKAGLPFAWNRVGPSP